MVGPQVRMCCKERSCPDHHCSFQCPSLPSSVPRGECFFPEGIGFQCTTWIPIILQQFVICHTTYLFHQQSRFPVATPVGKEDLRDRKGCMERKQHGPYW